jgi:hypothetical protein
MSDAAVLEKVEVTGNFSLKQSVILGGLALPASSFPSCTWERTC